MLLMWQKKYRKNKTLQTFYLNYFKSKRYFDIDGLQNLLTILRINYTYILILHQVKVFKSEMDTHFRNSSRIKWELLETRENIF